MKLTREAGPESYIKNLAKTYMEIRIENVCVGVSVRNIESLGKEVKEVYKISKCINTCL